MPVRQVIGKRRTVSAMQSRGILRRALLVEAAIELLRDNSAQEISLKHVAELAGVPEGSAYHFYANKYDLFSDVATQFAQLFDAAFALPIEQPVNAWYDVMDTFIDRAAEIYHKNPEIQELLIGTTTPPEIKQTDTELVRHTARTMVNRLTDHFRLPDVEAIEFIMFYVVELIDTMFAISVREHGCINDEILEEAKRMVRGYLGTYLPPILSKA